MPEFLHNLDVVYYPVKVEGSSGPAVFVVSIVIIGVIIVVVILIVKIIVLLIVIVIVISTAGGIDQA